jgi:hypothetical protein
MSTTQTTITYTDPRYFEGDPFEVADQAVAQAEAAVELSQKALADAEVMARNAELERQLYAKGKCDAEGWPTSPQGRQYDTLGKLLDELRSRLGTLRRAACFNPRRPPKA